MKNKSKKRSKGWDEMAVAERKIALCKDVIKQIRASRVTIDKGNYIKNNNGDDLRDILCEIFDACYYDMITPDMCDMIKKECTMCARGALLISRIDKFNTLKIVDIDNDGVSTSEGLNGAFDEEELCLIETAFEKDTYFYEDYYSRRNVNTGSYEDIEKLANAAKKFGENFPDHSDRLMAICQNIIDHKGEFRPEVEYEIVN